MWGADRTGQRPAIAGCSGTAQPVLRAARAWLRAPHRGGWARRIAIDPRARLWRVTGINGYVCVAELQRLREIRFARPTRWLPPVPKGPEHERASASIIIRINNGAKIHRAET